MPALGAGKLEVRALEGHRELLNPALRHRLPAMEGPNALHRLPQQAFEHRGLGSGGLDAQRRHSSAGSGVGIAIAESQTWVCKSRMPNLDCLMGLWMSSMPNVDTQMQEWVTRSWLCVTKSCRCVSHRRVGVTHHPLFVTLMPS